MTESRMRVSVVLAFVLLFCGACKEKVGQSASVADPWVAPVVAVAPASLPKLAQPFQVDGDLSEWAGAASAKPSGGRAASLERRAACVPIRYRSYIASTRPPREWGGPADLSMEVYSAWNSDGLCLGVVAADDAPRIERGRVTFYVDGRAADKLLKYPYTQGFYRIQVQPSSSAPDARMVVTVRNGTIADLKSAGKRTPWGYAAELLVPWSAFQAVTPKSGAQIGLQFSLDDAGERDPKLTEPLILNYRGAKNLTRSASGLMRWTLADNLAFGAKVLLGPLAPLDFPGVCADAGALPISVEVGKALSSDVGTVHIAVTDRDGKSWFTRTVDAAPLPAPWAESVGARTECPTDSWNDGFYTVTAVIADKGGQPLGMTARPLLVARRAYAGALSRLERANVSALSQTQPFKAAAYLGAASAFERLKRGVETGDPVAAANAVREVSNKLEVLDKGRLKSPNPGIFDLLLLGAIPEAQVVVEYPSSSAATVSFFCGGAPLACANVRQYAANEAAAKALESAGTRFQANFMGKTTVNGRPAKAASRAFAVELCRLSDLQPDRQVLLAAVGKKEAFVLALDELAHARAEAVVIQPDCPPPVREKVEAWASQARLPLCALAEAARKSSFLLAGKPDADAEKFFKGHAVRLIVPMGPYTEMTVLANNRLVNVGSPSAKAAEMVVEMVLAGKPITPAQTDALRAQIVKDLAPRNAARPVGNAFSPANLFSGDLHMHTFYSDGSPSPVGLALQAIHCYLDYAVITDHNAIGGAQVAQKLLARYGFEYPLIVGQEVTMKWSHMNAFPLKELIAWDLSPEDTVAAAHKQSAVIMWNHPEAINSEWSVAHTAIPLAGTGVDAWEHVPPRYDEWKKAGTLPAVVGTTDTHSGTFAAGDAGLARSIIEAPRPGGNDLADAIRKKNVAAAYVAAPYLFYGPDRMTGLVWAALADGKALKAARAERLKETLRNADLIGLLRESPSRPVRPETLDRQKH